MRQIATRELRNDTAGVLRRVSAGEQVVITVAGSPVATLSPYVPARRRWLPREELAQLLQTSQADPGLRQDLARLAGESTDDLEPLA